MTVSVKKKADLILCYLLCSFHSLNLNIFSWDKKRRSFHGSMYNCLQPTRRTHTCKNVCSQHLNCEHFSYRLFWGDALLLPLSAEQRKVPVVSRLWVCVQQWGEAAPQGELSLLHDPHLCLSPCPLKLSWVLNCYLRRAVEGSPSSVSELHHMKSLRHYILQ